MKSRSFRIGTFLFQPTFLPTVLTLGMFICLLSLGTWQIERLHQKTVLLASLHQRYSEAPLEVGAITPEQSDFHPAYAEGFYVHEKTLYVIGMSETGEGGYRVMVPLKRDQGPYLLVDRGWVPFSERVHPHYSMPQEKVRISGLLRRPHANWLTPTNNPTRGEWYWPDINAIELVSKLKPFLPFVLVAANSSSTEALPQMIPPHIDIPNNHLGYALTWYALALIVLIIYGIAQTRNSPSDHEY